jgi:hypothetical protein
MKPCSTVLLYVLLCVLKGVGTTQYAIHKRLDRAYCSTISRAIYALEIIPLVMSEGGEKMVVIRTQKALCTCRGERHLTTGASALNYDASTSYQTQLHILPSPLPNISNIFFLFGILGPVLLSASFACIMLRPLTSYDLYKSRYLPPP